MAQATSANAPRLPDPDPASSDALGETLHSLRLRGVVYARSHLTAPWGVDMPGMPECVMFHVVTAGECVLEFEDREPAVLRPGEFALMPRSEGHAIKHARGADSENYFDLPIERVTDRYVVLRYGCGLAETTLICGAVCFEHPAARDLVELLPSLIHIKTWDSPSAEWMQSTLRLMGAEAGSSQPGGDIIVTRLADILVIQAIRAWLVENPGSRRGWLGALSDERIGPALQSIHRDPTRAWDLATLASMASMSRSAFSARFTELVGESAMQYVTRWRMHVAGAWLRDSEMTASECGAKLGYNSEASFSRAFKKVMGKPPGAWKAASRSGLP